MRYISTRSAAPELGFDEAMLTGLARDGGLYVPAEIPQMSPSDIAALAGLEYEEIAFRVMAPFVGNAIGHEKLRDCIERAYAGFRHPARAPLTQLAPNHFLLELFHGPTLAVDGDFDDCQARLKDMFNDHTFRDEVHLAGVNSINWARVLAQVVYYFSSAVSLGAPHRPVRFTVPTGNFGDIFAGYVARKMGLPIDELVIATNQNDILHRALSTGDYRTGQVIPSISPSMDIQVSSNFERALFDAYGRDGRAVAQLMDELKAGGFSISQGALSFLRDQFSSGRVSEEETSAEISAQYQATGMLLCPHSAVGTRVAGQHLGPVPMITLATAHPAKFPAAVEAATGVHPPLPSHMADLFDREERLTRVANDLATLQSFVRGHIRQ